MGIPSDAAPTSTGRDAHWKNGKSLGQLCKAGDKNDQLSNNSLLKAKFRTRALVRNSRRHVAGQVNPSV